MQHIAPKIYIDCVIVVGIANRVWAPLLIVLCELVTAHCCNLQTDSYPFTGINHQQDSVCSLHYDISVSLFILEILKQVAILYIETLKLIIKTSNVITT